MRAAWTLARRGHGVTLFEARDILGDQKSRRELVGIINWLAGRLDEEAIDRQLSMRASIDDLTGIHHHHVIGIVGNTMPIFFPLTSRIPASSRERRSSPSRRIRPESIRAGGMGRGA
ncbi:MAG: hypothetical protein ACR2RF_11875 [Geminicoccaceae bacterium]